MATPRDALGALESIEVAAQFVASDAAQLLGSLQAGLQSLSHASVDHMTVYRDAAVHTRDAVSDAVATGRGFIDKCERLDERMVEVERIAAQLADVDRALTALEVSFPAPRLPPKR